MRFVRDGRIVEDIYRRTADDAPMPADGAVLCRRRG